MYTVRTAALALALLLAAGAPAFAWGASGHRFVSGAAAATLPDSVPAFVRTPQARGEIERLGPEPDRLRGSGKTRDSDLDPGHFLDPSTGSNYPKKDYHRMYFGEIAAAAGSAEYAR